MTLFKNKYKIIPCFYKTHPFIMFEVEKERLDGTTGSSGMFLFSEMIKYFINRIKTRK